MTSSSIFGSDKAAASDTTVYDYKEPSSDAENKYAVVFETGLPEEVVESNVQRIIDNAPDGHVDEDADILLKGAFLANDESVLLPHKIEKGHYTQEEVDLLDYESRHSIKSQSKWMFLLAITSSFAALNFGMDESAVGGAQLQYIQEFNITDANVQGTVNAIPYLAAAVLGSPVVVLLDKHIGRKLFLLISCVIGVAGSLWQAFSPNMASLLVARIFLGVGMGINSSVVPMLIAESSPARSRGAFLMLWQTFVATGVMLGSVFNRAFVDLDPKISWRLMIGSSSVAPLICFIFALFITESPRWLISVGRHHEALDVLFKLRTHKLAGARDFYIIYESLRKVGEIEKIPVLEQVKLMIFDTRVRFGAVVSLFNMFMQQYCGVNVLVGYTPTILVNAGISPKTAIAGSIGIGGGCALATLVSTQLIDNLGRRKMLLFTFPILAGCMFWLGASLYIVDNASRLGSGLAAMYLFTLTFGLGIGPVSWTMNSEVYPLHVRSFGVPLGMGWNWLLDFVLTMTWPKMAESMTTSGGLYFYGGWNLFAFFFTFLFVPETMRLSLEQLDELFSQGISRFARSRLSQVKKA
ncbi:Putative hexose transporter [Komagataella phaffii CBS 7435]|uniref:Major facilitator superfamily n=2 Tax=Komagataella phaffii TaxID=460519 RepID=C4R9E3_KOMPG|nr:GQ67_01371T0 [Komagataella phaffii]AOA66213.1 GQ68_01387T0 [Komagataella phaffii GS115]CAH2447452.1 Putative hexose transporter [Komagataella phaffii CBS 7435]CAY67038.1 Major facilitator superfamily [Komagataella pastoris]CCA37681.1 Putative hexose transporter [Komagataella phaffii CBS 7435]